MHQTGVLLSIVFGAFTVALSAQEQDPTTPRSSTPTKATYLIGGLHCPPCTRTVETSLKKIDGVRSVEVDWKGKYARIEFDEAVLPAQRVGQLIAPLRT